MSDSEPQHSVTFCITELDVGGAEKSLVRIATGLKDRGWKVRVISLRDAGPMAAELEQANIPVEALNCGSFADIRTYWRLKKAVKSHVPDVLVCFLHQANFYGRLVARRLQIPNVSGIRVADRRKLIAWTEKATKRYVTRYIAVSQHVAKTHSDLCGIQSDRITAIPNGVDDLTAALPPKSSADSLIQGTPFRLLFVGRLTRQKAPGDLVNAFSLLPDDLRASTHLTFVGEGELRTHLKDQITTLGLSEQVSLAGQCDNPLQLMAQSTLLVLPSLWEGMPNVVLEAMAAGLPVIATDVDGTRELILPEINGWLVPPARPNRLAEVIRLALEDSESRTRFSKTSQTIVQERFSWNSICDRYQDELRSIVGQPTL